MSPALFSAKPGEPAGLCGPAHLCPHAMVPESCCCTPQGAAHVTPRWPRGCWLCADMAGAVLAGLGGLSSAWGSAAGRPPHHRSFLLLSHEGCQFSVRVQAVSVFSFTAQRVAVAAAQLCWGCIKAALDRGVNECGRVPVKLSPHTHSFGPHCHPVRVQGCFCWAGIWRPGCRVLSVYVSGAFVAGLGNP